jgi:HSP20 family protein
MSVVKYTPNGVFRHLDRNEFLTPFDKIFDEILTHQFPEITKEVGVGFFEKQSYPRVDVIDYADRVEIKAEIPGLTKEEVSVDVEDNVLTITGNKVKKAEVKDQGVFIRRELKHSSFKRSFTLSDSLTSNEPVAKFENGLLTITLAKLKPVPPTTKKIKIN